MFVRAGEGLFLVPQWHSLEQSLLPVLQGQPLRFSDVSVEHVALQKQLPEMETQKRYKFRGNITQKKTTKNDMKCHPRQPNWFFTASDAITLDLDWQNGVEAKKLWYA